MSLGKGFLRVTHECDCLDEECKGECAKCMNGVASIDDTEEEDNRPTTSGALTLEPDECIVSLAENGTGYIIARSDDIVARDILIEDTAEDCGFNISWDDNLLVGTYKLKIKPWAHQCLEGEWDCGIDILEVTPLWTVPAIELPN